MKKLLEGCSQWIRLNALLLACMIVMRPIFFLEIFFRVGLEPIHFFTILSGALFDLLLVCRIFVFGLVPFLLLHYFFPKTARGVFIGLILLYTVVNALLAEYYCNLTVPLDHVILVYSWKDLMTTLSSSSSLSLAQVLWFLLSVAPPVLLVCFWKKFEVGRWWSLGIVLACLLATILVPYRRLIREERLYPTHFDFCLAVNQPSYSYTKIMDYLKNESRSKSMAENNFYDENMKKAVDSYQAGHPEFDYDHEGYPFYRKFTETDVLGPFLNNTSDGLPPNLVFIIVEGLGRKLTGVNNPQRSFTPFIDSLAAEGLFWQHCLSTAERTFGVIPSVFASAPHGRYGFSTTLAPTPRHHSLLRDLEHNGYYTSFFYGGDPTFDHYDFFMKSNHVDYIFSPTFLVDDSAHYQLLVDNHRWGLDDDQLVLALEQQKKSDTARRPFADIMLTLSTHEPFVVDGLEKYEERVKAMVELAPTLSDYERRNILKNLNIFACYLYLDESIRHLMDYYASRPDYGNTVFILTGDHRMAPLPFGSAIHKYNVPLVIYSPLLKRPKSMDPVVSHLDITPTLNAYLRDNYDYEISDHCHWLGTTLDTVTEFRNTRKLLFMLNNRDVVDYYSGDYLISNSNLIRLDDHLTETILQDEQRFNQMKSELEDFDLVSRFVVQNDYLMPQESHGWIYTSHLDFKNSSLSVFDKIIVKDSGFLHVDNTVEYLSLCPDITLLPIYQDIFVEISFDVRSANTTVPLPALVVNCVEGYAQQPLVSSSNAPLNTGRWEHFHIRIPIHADRMTEAEALKIYLWNKVKGEFYLDNLVVDVEGVLKDDKGK